MKTPLLDAANNGYDATVLRLLNWVIFFVAAAFFVAFIGLAKDGTPHHRDAGITAAVMFGSIAIEIYFAFRQWKPRIEPRGFEVIRRDEK